MGVSKMNQKIGIIIRKIKAKEELSDSENELVISILQLIDDSNIGNFEKREKRLESLIAGGERCPCCGGE